RPMEVNATEDCTVEGTRVRNKMPRYISSMINNVSGRSASPTMGKSTKVNIKMVRCSFQCLMPLSASCVDKRAPYRKNNTAMAILTSVENTSANCPRAGKIMAMMTANVIYH